LEWANSSFDNSHPFTNSSLFKSSDSESLRSAKVLVSSIRFSKTNLNLAKRSSILKNIHTSLDLSENLSGQPVTISRKVNRSSISYSFIGVAASLVALIAIVFVLNNNQPIQVMTGYGEVVSVDLPDGSVVNVDANSSISMINNWSNRRSRDIKLQNSAYFNVTNDPKIGGAAFNVLTNLATIEVIGTEFLVDSDPSNLTVLVKYGKVKVSPNNSSDFETQILTAGDKLIIKDGELLTSVQLNQKMIASELAWINGQISLQNTSFDELSTIVKERFNKTLVVDEALRTSTRAVDGTYPIMSVKSLLDPVATALDLQIRYNGDQIFLGYSKID